MKQNVRKSLFWAVILSELSHVFCCVLPTVFSLLSLLAGLGMAAALPPGMIALHEALHHWELPIITVSGLILAMGWGVTLYGERAECDHDGCTHEDTSHTHKNANLVMKIATVLFVVNLFIYVTVHRTNWLIDHLELLGVHVNAHADHDDDHHE